MSQSKLNVQKSLGVNSNHEVEGTHRDESHIIQYVDLIIGGFSQVLDNTSKRTGKCEVAKTLLKNRLPEEIMGYDDSTHFKSDYYKKYAVSFFPKTKLSRADIINKDIKGIFTGENQFYNKSETYSFYARTSPVCLETVSHA